MKIVVDLNYPLIDKITKFALFNNWQSLHLPSVFMNGRNE